MQQSKNRYGLTPPGIFKIDWEEHIIPIYAPCGTIVGPLGVEGKYTKHNRRTEPTFTLGEDYTISMLSLPPGYQWEIWRRRKRKKETWMQKGNADWAIERFGHFVLYDRLESGSTSYDPGLSSETIKFSIYNSQTGARSYLSNIGISCYTHKKKVFYV